MRLKSYFVHTMEEALQVAKVELGDEAMLVDSKRLETPTGGRARLEVIFSAPALPPAVPQRKVAPAGLHSLRGELASLLDALNRKPDSSRWEARTPQRDALRGRLLLAEVPPVVADEMVQQCWAVLERAVESIERAVMPLVAAEWPHSKTTAKKAARVMAFVGPTGAGKTSSVAKLAFRLGVAQNRPVSVLSIDNLRIGASDQLAHLCSLLGVPFQSLEYSGGLSAALASPMHSGLVLVDTPGYGPMQVDLMEEAAGQLRRVEDLECHLVLPATMRYSEMQRRRQQFKPFAPSKLLFTRLDETELFGPAWAMSRDARLPVDWVSTGPGIPEDLEEADASRFAAAVLGIAQQDAPRAIAARACASRN